MKQINLKDAALIIRNMPLDQAMQYLKSKLSGQPESAEIKGELIIKFIPEDETSN